MIILPDDFDYLLYLAEEIETGDKFEQDAKKFRQLAQMMRKRVYRYCKDAEILEMADKLPDIDFQPHQRSFLEQLLPKSGKGMVGQYKIRESVRQQVRRTVTLFTDIRRWLGEDWVDIPKTQSPRYFDLGDCVVVKTNCNATPQHNLSNIDH